MKTIKQSILTITIGLALAAGISYAWTPPAANPPDLNAPAPINVGPKGQTKEGGFGTTNSTQGLVAKGASSFEGATAFNNILKINYGSPSSGKVLKATNTDGTVAWTNLRIKNKVLIKEKTKSTNGPGTVYANGMEQKCETGWTMTGCSATCRGNFDESDGASPDLRPTDDNTGCRLGDNDACTSAKQTPRIKLFTTCAQIEQYSN